jgi:hypothetical protein
VEKAEIRRMEVQSQPRQIVQRPPSPKLTTATPGLPKTLSRKKSITKRSDGVAQGVDPEFKPQYKTKQKTHSKMDWRCGSSSRVGLLCKCEVLSLNPSPTKNINNSKVII